MAPRISPLLAAVTFVELVVALYLAVKLTFFTDLARRDWMWPMPPYGARYMGAIYLTALIPIGTLLATRSRFVARLVNPVVLIFGATLLAVSLIDLDRFRMDTWSTPLWFGLYVLMPAAAAHDLWRSRRRPLPAASPLASVPRTVAATAGAVLALYGLGLLAAPERLGASWPWTLDAFHGRLYSSVFLAPGAGALLLAWRGGTAIEQRVLGLTCAALGSLPIVGVATMDAALRRVDWDAPGPTAWVLGFAALAAAGVTLAHESSGVSVSTPSLGTVEPAAAERRVPLPLRVLRVYLFALGGILALQGLAALFLWVVGATPPLLMDLHLVTHPRHSAMHVGWGAVMLLVLAVSSTYLSGRQPRPGTAGALDPAVTLGVVFGLYYTGLALFVAFVGSPFGLHVTTSQNTFHFAVGPATLLLGLWNVWHLQAMRTTRGTRGLAGLWAATDRGLVEVGAGQGQLAAALRVGTGQEHLHQPLSTGGELVAGERHVEPPEAKR
jgi:hypothetical protein